MKKLATLLALSFAMTLVFGMTVCADEISSSTNSVEISADTGNSDVEAEASANGVTISNNVLVGNAEMKAVVKADTLENLILEEAKSLEVSTILREECTFKYIRAFDLNVHIDGVEPSASNPFTVTLTEASIKSGNTYYVLHKKSSDNQWEAIPAKVIADGKIQVTFTSFSPVAIYEVEKKEVPSTPEEPEKEPEEEPEEEPEPEPEEKKEEAKADTTAVATQSSVPTSPKTGETNSLLAVIALFCLVCAGFCVQKAKLKK